jgi:hypothetical protein
MLFRNFYHCERCSSERTDVSANLRRRLPFRVARHMSPYESEDAERDDTNDASKEVLEMSLDEP